MSQLVDLSAENVALKAEVKTLRAALREFARYLAHLPCEESHDQCHYRSAVSRMCRTCQARMMLADEVV